MKMALRLLIFAAAAALVSLQVPPAAAATFAVTKTADTNDGTCDADCSLREAIGAANALAGADIIDVPAGTYTLTIPTPTPTPTPRPTPTPTPVDIVRLPDSGGEPASSGSGALPWLVAIVGAIVVMSAGGVLVAGHRRR